MPFVVSKNNKPLMPCSETKARHLLEADEASIIEQAPYVVLKLNIESTEEIQEVVLCANISGNFLELVAFNSGEALYYKIQKIGKQSDAFGALLFIQKYIPVSKIIIGVGGYDIVTIDLQNETVKRKYDHREWSALAHTLTRDSHTCRVCEQNSSNIKLHNFMPNVHVPVTTISVCRGCLRRILNGELDDDEKVRYFKEEGVNYQRMFGNVLEAIKKVFNINKE